MFLISLFFSPTTFVIATQQGVMATVKHFANNNQEDNRFDVSANLLNDRTQVFLSLHNLSIGFDLVYSGKSIIQPFKRPSMLA